LITLFNLGRKTAGIKHHPKISRQVAAGSPDLPFALPEGVCYHSRQIEILQVIYHEQLGLRPGGLHQKREVESGKRYCQSSHLNHP
jgi:hypothetical protein